MNPLFQVNGDRFQLNVPLMKYDERTGEFEGWATVEELDHAGEIIDIEKSWPYFQRWSQKFAKATDGESYGNVREQHDPKKAAGKLTAIERAIHDTGADGIYVKGVAVDPVSKEKLAKRVLCGLSIGGKYVEKDDESGRYVADPYEISLVDAPCVENAMITVVKSDGQAEVGKAVGYVPPQGFQCRGGAFHSRKAEALKCDESHIVTETIERAEDPLRKSLYGISNLVSLLATLLCITSDAEWEETWEAIEGEAGDNTISIRLKEIAQLVFNVLEAMIADERSEIDGDLAEALSSEKAMAALVSRLKTSATAQQFIKSLRVPSGNGSINQQKEDTMEKKKEETTPTTPETVAKTDEGAIAKSLDSLTKAIGEMSSAVVKDRERVDTVEKSVETLEKGVELMGATLAKTLAFVAGVKVEDDTDLEEVLKAIQAKPAAPKAALRAVAKTADGDEAKPPAPQGNPLVDGARLIAQF